MRDGWEYVVASYGIVALTLGIWFWMILAKLRRQRDVQQQAPGGSDA